jgi:hypothetical protein
MLIQKNREQLIADAKKKTEEMNEHNNRSKLYQEQETRRNNQNYKFERYIRDVKNNEDKITKSVMNVSQSYEEFEDMLSNFNLRNTDELKLKMQQVLADTDISAYHVRKVTAFAEYLLHQHKHAYSLVNKKTSEVKIF